MILRRETQQKSTPDARKSKGSLIVENMMAMLIFSAGVGAIFALDTRLTDMNQESFEYITATTLARNTFEDLRRRDPESYTSLPKGTIGPLNSTGQPSASGKYTLTWDYTTGIPHTGMNQVSITVSWIDSLNHKKNMSFSSMIRTPRTKPAGVILNWSGNTTSALANYGTCTGP